jgi:DNA-binding protein H-NS
MATLESIQAKIAKLQSQAEALVKKQSAGVVAQIHSLMAKHGLTVADLGSVPHGKAPRVKADTTASSSKSAGVAKYRDPKSGATWSGHGRAPGWIANAKNRDKFLIDSSAGSASFDGEKTAKPVGNYVRGPQPAKYRDPKSGAEWSGRGKAPGWLAGAKDRTKFLVNGAAAASADDNESVPKTVAGKKAGAKKTTATASPKKAVAKKASVTSAKAAAGKNAAAKKSTSAARKGPLAGGKKTGAKKVATKGGDVKATAQNPADLTTLLPATSGSEVDAVSSAG